MALYSQIEDRYLAALTAVQFPEAPVADTQQPVTDATSVDGMQLAAGPSQTMADAGQSIGPIPRNKAQEALGYVGELLTKAGVQLDQYGLDVPGLGRITLKDLTVGDAGKVIEDMSYGFYPVRGGNSATGGIGTFGLKPDAAMELMNVAPAAGAAAKAGVKAGVKGAMAVGRAGERIAEKTVPQIMEKGGTLAELLQALSQGSSSQLTAYHGTPHSFDKFDASKIGTGEGNQTFGYGLYFAESKDVAQAYQTTLGESKRVYTLNGKEIQRESLNEIDKLALNIAARPNEYTLQALEDSGLGDDAVSKVKAALKKYKGAKFEEVSSGNLYTVDIPDEMVSKMLDFDKPLSQQPKNVQDALAKLGFTVDKKKVDEYSDALLSALSSDAPADLPKQPLDLSGESIYRQLARNASNINPLNKQRDALIEKYQKGDMSMADAVRAMNPEDRAEFSRIAQAIDNTKNAAAVASEALRQAGIPGIRYLDQGSRGTGKGTRNIVVFPGGEDQVKILKQEGKK